MTAATRHPDAGAPSRAQSSSAHRTALRSQLISPLGAGAVGSLLVALGSYGVGDIPRNNTWLQDAGLAWVTYGHGRSVASLLFWAGVAVMVCAWIVLGRPIRLGTGALPGMTALRWWVVAWVTPLLFAVPVYSRDVYAYLAQASLVSHGFNPYADGPVNNPGPLLDSMAQVWATTTAPYGPAFMLIARGVVAVTGDNPVAGVAMMRLVMLPGVALAVWAVPLLAKHFPGRRRDPAAAGMWLVLFNPMILIHTVGGPHVEMLLMGVLAAGLLLVVRGAHVPGVVVLAVATGIKITAGVALPFVVWIWLDHIRSRRAVRPRDVAGVFAGVIVVSSVVFGILTAAEGHGLGWLTGLGWADRIINWLTVPTLIAHVITWAAAPAATMSLLPVLAVTRLIGEIVMAMALVVIWWWARRDERTAMLGLTLAMSAVLLLEPSSLPWYYVWALIPAVACAPGRRMLGVVVAGSTFMLLAFAPDDSILLYEPGKLTICVLVSALAGWVVATDHRFGSAERYSTDNRPVTHPQTPAGTPATASERGSR